MLSYNFGCTYKKQHNHFYFKERLNLFILFFKVNKYLFCVVFFYQNINRSITTMKWVLTLFVMKALTASCQNNHHHNRIREWNELDFNFSSAFDRQDAINKEWFIPHKSFPLDVDVDYHGLFKIKI